MDGSAAASAIERPFRSKDGRKPFVMIDGFNLSLEKGTGVATYARNLSYGLRDIGCDVGVLYGNSSSAAHSPLLREVMFFDTAPPEVPRWLKRLQQFRSLFGSRSAAFEVPLTGAVVADAFKSKLPHQDSVWNAQDLFDKAHAKFTVLGTTHRVTVPRKPDVCHWTYPLPIRMPGVPNIYTLHDLVPLRLPHTTLDRKARYLKLLKWICRTADHIVTVSENSKNDIVNLLGVAPEKVTNTYQAVTIPSEYSNKPEADVRRELEHIYGLQYKQYFLFFGSIEPKKNIGRMTEGYLASGVSTPLVLVGAQEWKSKSELRMLAAEQVRAKLGTESGRATIVQLEYAPHAHLVSLIRGARAVLFPSLYEGFGLPVLEAMSLGTPVLTSNVSSLPEIAEGAAVSINPYNSAEIAEAISRLDADDDLCAALAHAGRKRAEMFSKDAYDRRLAGLYERLLQRSATAALAR